MKNSLRRIAALLMAIMMLAALGMSVSADEVTAVESVNFTKNLTKETNVYAPNTTYTFTIAPGAADAANAIFAGVAGGAKFEDATQTVSDNGTKLTVTSTPDSVSDWTYTGKIALDVDCFTAAGIYRYTVSEGAGTYAGITYDTTPRTLDVYVAEDGAADSFKIVAAILHYEEDESVNKTGIFTNSYDTANLTVSKKVDGNLGETGKTFAFNITVTGENGENYHVVLPGTDNTATITAGTAYQFSLKHGESITVYGLSEGDSYTVTENDYSDDGYTTTIKVNGAEATAATGSIAAATDDNGVANATVEFTNTRNFTPPTGVALTILPFVAMIAIAAAVVVIFFKKKERREA